MENRIRYNQAMKILLTTLHAKYVHSSLALPYLAAACGNIEGIETAIREFTVNERHDLLLKKMAAEGADITAFSCYIWNIEQTLKLASDLKKILPKTCVILGGPEVSYNPEEILRNNAAVDCVIGGEGEDIFYRLVTAWKQDENFTRSAKSVGQGIAFRDGTSVIVSPPAGPVRDLDTIPSPFSAGLVDMEKPLVYYETSRGCPFSCAFCMSSLGSGVNSFSMERIRQDLLYLMDHETATVKLVDRTFNYDADRADAIWEFILRHNRSSRFHFEIAADLLTEKNLEILAKVPNGMFRFEIGVQSGKTATLEKVARKSDLDRLFGNVGKLLSETGVIVHLDLVAGLPGEDYSGFLASLQRLLDPMPHFIQVEPLKVLKGSPMERIAARDGYVLSDYPPYKILGTADLPFHDISRVETVSGLLDVFFNSGRFLTVLKTVSEREALSGFFHCLAIHAEKENISAGLSLRGSFEMLYDFMSGHFTEEVVRSLREALCYDFCLCEYPVSGNIPDFLQPGEIARPKISTGEIVKSLRIDGGSKVRCFARRFPKDYTSNPWRDQPTDILFVYISAPGKGLQVKPAVFPG